MMLKQKFLVQFASNISIKIVGLVAGIVVARVAGPEVLGMISYGAAYVGVFGFIIGIFGSAHIKMISEGQDIGTCIATFTRLQVISLLSFFTIVLGWFLFQKYILYYDFQSVVQEQVIILTLLATIVIKFVNFSNTSFTGQLKQAKANAPSLIRGILFHLGKILIVVLGFRAIGLASWNLISAIILLPYAFKLFRSLPYGRFSRLFAKQYIKYGIPLFLIVLLNTIMGNVDKLILHKYTDVTELGYYSVAYSLGGMILLVSGTIGTIFFPLFSSLIANKDWKIINDKISSFQSFITIFIFPSIVLMAIIAEPLLISLLGEEYINSIEPFVILLFASYFSIVGMPYSNIINGMGRFYLSLGLNVIKFILFLFILIYLISPEYLGLGAIGVALCVLIINFINNSLFFIVSKWIGDVRVYLKNYLSYLVIILISAGVLALRPFMMELSNLWWLIIIIPYILVIYLSLFFTGLLKWTQVQNLLVLLNIQSTIRYIKDEINE